MITYYVWGLGCKEPLSRKKCSSLEKLVYVHFKEKTPNRIQTILKNLDGL